MKALSLSIVFFALASIIFSTAVIADEAELSGREDSHEIFTGHPPAPPIVSCNWIGSRFVSHGWDAGCAWSTGMYISCQAGRVTGISYVESPSCPRQR